MPIVAPFTISTAGQFATGEVAGSATASQLPSIPCFYAKIKAESDNAGKVYLGQSTVTKADGATDVTTGWHLAAGEEVEMFISNLNLLYRICDNSGDDLEYFVYIN